MCGGDSDGRAPAVSGTAEQGAVFRIKGDPQDMPPAGQQPRESSGGSWVPMPLDRPEKQLLGQPLSMPTVRMLMPMEDGSWSSLRWRFPH